jgi:hypothetical protein
MTNLTSLGFIFINLSPLMIAAKQTTAVPSIDNKNIILR